MSGKYRLSSCYTTIGPIPAHDPEREVDPCRYNLGAQESLGAELLHFRVRIPTTKIRADFPEKAAAPPLRHEQPHSGYKSQA
jgi:hypothetical protein